MKVCFLGTPDFAAKCLDALIKNSKYEVCAVFTQPDKKVGRKQLLTMPPVKILALENNISVYQPVKIKDQQWIETIKELDPDVIVTAAFGQILSKELLEIPKFGTINVHGSLLPKYRGSAPIQWAVINGEKVTGITTMLTDVGIDTGDMLLKKQVEILPQETSGELFDRLSDIGAKCLIETLDNLQNIKPTMQNDAESSYYPMLDKDMAKLDFNNCATKVFNLIRGLNPWPICYFELNGEKIKVYSSQVVDISGQPGEVLCWDKSGIIIGCNVKSIKLLQLQAPGKKVLDAKEFVNGKNVKVGEIIC